MYFLRIGFLGYFWKTKDIHEYYNCHLNAEPGYCISIDESMIAFKGRHAAKQYLPRKPIK